MTAEEMRFIKLIWIVRIAVLLGLTADVGWILKGSAAAISMMSAMLLFVFLIVLLAYSLSWTRRRRLMCILEAVEEAQENGPEARLSKFKRWLIAESFLIASADWKERFDKELERLLGG